MSKAKFTPGPLFVRDRATGLAYERCCIVDTTGMDIGESYSDPFNGVTPEAVHANGRLWAAAPDLYAACKALAEVSAAFQSGKRDGATMGMVSLAMDAARAALSKAEGVTVKPSRVNPGEPDPRD